MNYLQELLDAYYLMRDNEELLLERRYTQDERNTALQAYATGLSKGAGLSGQTEKYVDKKGQPGVRAKRQNQGQLNIFKTAKGPVSFEPVSGSLPWFNEKAKSEKDIGDNQRLQVYVGRLLSNLPAEDPEKDTDEPQKEVVQAKSEKDKAKSKKKIIDQAALEQRLQIASQLREEKFKSEHDVEIYNSISDATKTSMDVFGSAKFKETWLEVIEKNKEYANKTEDPELQAALLKQADALQNLVDQYSKLGTNDIVDLMAGVSAEEGPFRKISVLTKLAHPKYYISVQRTTDGLIIKTLDDNADQKNVAFENHVRRSAARAIQALSSATKNLTQGKSIDSNDLLYLQNLQFDENGKNLRIIPTNNIEDSGLILGNLQDNHPLVMLAKTYNELLNKESDPEKKAEYEKYKCKFQGTLSRLTAGAGKADSQLYKQIGTFAEKVATVTIPLFHQLRNSLSLEEKQKVYSDMYRRIRLIQQEFNSEVLSDVTKTLLSEGLGNVAISDDAAKYIQELKEYAVKNSGGIDEDAVKSLVNNIVETGLKLSAMTYQQRRTAIDCFTVGEKQDVSNKKPDNIELYSSYEEARESLLREGIPESQVESILLSVKKVEQYYVKNGLRNKNAVVAIPVGLKTVMGLKDGVKFGTTMITAYLSNVKETSSYIKTLNNQFDSMSTLLEKYAPAQYDTDKKKKKYKLSAESISKLREGLSQQLASINLDKVLGSNPTASQLKTYTDLKDRIAVAETNEEMIELVQSMRHQLTVDNLKGLYNKGPEGKKNATQELLNMLKYSTSSTDFGMISQIQTFGEKKPRSICVSHNHMLDFYINQISNNSTEYDFEVGETGGFSFYKYEVVVDKNGIKKRVKDKKGKYKKVKMGKVYMKKQDSSSQIQTYFNEEGLNTYISDNPDAKASNSVVLGKKSAANDSTLLLVNFLKGQKELLEQLLSRV